MRNIFVIAAAGAFIALGASLVQASETALTISRVDLPIPVAERPFCVSLPEDGKLIVFQSARAGGHGKSDIWFSRWENGRWSEPYNAGPGINTASSEVDAKFSPDGSTMVFIRGDDFRKSSQIYLSQFQNGQWSEARPIGAPASPLDTVEYGAVLSRDGKRLYYASNRPGGLGGFDLYYSDRTGSGWSEPVSLGPTINTPENDVDVALSRDGKTIVFPARREDAIGGSTDLYMSRWENGAWTPVQNLGPRVNTPATDTCPWLGFDGHTLYLNTEWDGLLAGEKRSTWVWKIHYSNGF